MMIITQENALGPPIRLYTQPEFFPRYVYRFFKQEWEADALCRGQVFVSTVERCRRYEALGQGDPDETKKIYNSGAIQGSSGEPRFEEVVSRLNARFERCTDIVLDDCEFVSSYPDAWVLCFTLLSQSPDVQTFGNFGVRIRKPADFFRRVTAALRGRGLPVMAAAFGAINYKDRAYMGLAPDPGPRAFIKPVSFKSQCEARMIWHPHRFPITHEIVNCPAIRPLVSRV
jgi:hypothetical protein